MQIPQEPECRRVTAMIVDRILAAAREDDRGIYWECELRYSKPADQALADISLLHGSSGILLFLAEYHRRTANPRVAEMLKRGLAWLKNRADETPVRHGFYYGHAGYLYARTEIARALGRTAETEEISSATKAFTKLLVGDPAPYSNVVNGTAGTLLGLLAISAPEFAEQTRNWLPELFRRIARSARLTDRGIYWDRYRTAARANVGFLAGTVGVEYVLSHCLRDSTQGLAWLVSGACAYDNGEFDAEMGNWRDYTHRRHFESLATRERLRAAAAAGEISEFLVFGDSIGWDNGAAGVLVARLALEQAGYPTPATVDIERAIRRIAAEMEKSDDTKSRFTLRDGWGGVALSLADPRLWAANPSARQLTTQIIARCLAQHAKLGAFRLEQESGNTGHGLFSGEAGIGYFLLKLTEENPRFTSLLCPAVRAEVRHLPSFGERECLAEVVKGNWPRTSRLYNDQIAMKIPAHATHPEVLSVLSEVVSPGLARSVFEYETEKLEIERQQDACNYVWYSDVHRRQNYEQQWRDAPDERLLQQCIALAPTVEVGQVAFRINPQDRLSLPAPGSTLVLLKATSDRVRERILSPVSYTIYSHLKHGIMVRQLVETLGQKYPSLVQAAGENLEQIIIQHVRSGLQAGVLIMTAAAR